jgi:hypothetical protein
MDERNMTYQWDVNRMIIGFIINFLPIIEFDDGKIYRKPLYLMVKTMVSCKFSLKPIQ